MLAGLPARMIYIDTGAATLNYGGMLPSDLDGPAPAVGTPNYFMEWDDSTWYGRPGRYPAHLGIQDRLGRTCQHHLWPERQL